VTASGRYLYERLGADGFQRLIAALLAAAYPDVVCYPVGQSDGGRDAARTAGGGVVYQVKWAKSKPKQVVTWLDKAVAGEADNMRRLVSQGVSRYVLVTSVEGTSPPGRGEMDQLDARLAAHAAVFGVPMECWWRSDVDARVDAAPKELKWAHGEMLAGYDSFRYLLDTEMPQERDRDLRALLLGFAATQWQEDSRVKFRQTELDTYELADLFVDLPYQREPPSARPAGGGPLTEPGVTALLLSEGPALTLIKGEPGQGKSTVVQFLCQTHRAGFLPNVSLPADMTGSFAVPHPRWPIRADLRDYATWLAGADPFSDGDKPDGTKRRRRAESVEAFLADLITARSGGVGADAETVRDIVQRLPTFVVLDGLDEVAQPAARAKIVREIEEFAARLGAGAVPPQLVVTTRPNNSDLAEPSARGFRVLRLARLDEGLRITYLRRWCNAMGLAPRSRRSLEGHFRARSAEPHVAQLADNPMQLTILLYLINKRGESVPARRSQLYMSFMEAFLDREAEKTQAVREHRADLEEVTAFLGWRLQARAERGGADGRLPLKELKKEITGHLIDVEKSPGLVDELFDAVTERVWALTSKVSGTFEFDVQPIREYFAARYLYEYAGASGREGVDKGAVLRELIRRPYWENTGRFYAGFANVNELAALKEGLQDELEEGRRPKQAALGTWRLLFDGVFAGRPARQRVVAQALTSDLTVRLLAAQRTGKDMALPVDRGGQELAGALVEDLSRVPSDPLSAERAAVAAPLQAPEQSDAWWTAGLAAAAADEAALASWLIVATPARSGARLPPADVDRITITAATAEAVLGCGVRPVAGSEAEQALVRFVLDGSASDAEPVSPGLPADLIRVLAPQHHLRRVGPEHRAYHVRTQHPDAAMSEPQRRAALSRLTDADGRFEAVRRALRHGKGQSGTTSVWGDTARALTGIYGPCWLAVEIALIGASLPSDVWRTGGSITAGAAPFGPAHDTGMLLAETRRNRASGPWWTDQLRRIDDDLSLAAWALAAIAVADDQIVLKLIEPLGAAVRGLPPDRLTALLASSSRIGASGHARRLTSACLAASAACDPALALLVAHHAAGLDEQDSLRAFPDERLAAMADFGAASWPAHRAASARLVAEPGPAALRGVRRAGPRAVVTAGDLLAGEFADQILDEPAAYPLAWVEEAERERSARPVPTVWQVARTDRWFGPGDG
jgi:hypothetical protein